MDLMRNCTSGDVVINPISGVWLVVDDVGDTKTCIAYIRKERVGRYSIEDSVSFVTESPCEYIVFGSGESLINIWRAKL